MNPPDSSRARPFPEVARDFRSSIDTNLKVLSEVDVELDSYIKEAQISITEDHLSGGGYIVCATRKVEPHFLIKSYFDTRGFFPEEASSEDNNNVSESGETDPSDNVSHSMYIEIHNEKVCLSSCNWPISFGCFSQTGKSVALMGAAEASSGQLVINGMGMPRNKETVDESVFSETADDIGVEELSSDAVDGLLEFCETVGVDDDLAMFAVHYSARIRATGAAAILENLKDVAR